MPRCCSGVPGELPGCARREPNVGPICSRAGPIPDITRTGGAIRRGKNDEMPETAHSAKGRRGNCCLDEISPPCDSPWRTCSGGSPPGGSLGARSALARWSPMCVGPVPLTVWWIGVVARRETAVNDSRRRTGSAARAPAPARHVPPACPTRQCARHHNPHQVVHHAGALRGAPMSAPRNEYRAETEIIHHPAEPASGVRPVLRGAGSRTGTLRWPLRRPLRRHSGGPACHTGGGRRCMRDARGQSTSATGAAQCRHRWRSGGSARADGWYGLIVRSGALTGSRL